MLAKASMNASGCPAGMRPARRADSHSHGEPRVRMRRGPSTREWTRWLGSSGCHLRCHDEAACAAVVAQQQLGVVVQLPPVAKGGEVGAHPGGVLSGDGGGQVFGV